MAKQFKFRYVNQIAGGFVLLCVLGVIAAVVATAYSQKWFTSVRKLTIVLPEEGSMGLRKGADVMLLGTVVGSVQEITMDPSGRMEGEIRIREDFYNFIRSDSTVTIKKTMGFVGDAIIEITKGKGAALPLTGARMTVKVDRGMTELVQEIIEQLRANAIPAVEDARAVVANVAALLDGLRDPQGPMQQTLANVQRMTESVVKREGLVGKVLSDPKLAEQIDSTLPKLAASLDEVQKILQDTRKTTANLPEITAAAAEQIKRLPALIQQTQGLLAEVQLLVKDVQKTTAGMPRLVESAVRTLEGMPGLVMQTQETLRQTQRLIEGFQRHWLVRSYIEQEDRTRRLAPETVGGAP